MKMIQSNSSSGSRRRWTVVAVLALGGCGEGAGPSTEELSQIQKEIALQNEQTASDSAPNVRPLLKCVEMIGPGQFKAHFGYNNKTNTTQNLPIGNFNRFVPDSDNRGQPTTFNAGVQTDVFTVTWNGRALAWLLAKHFVVASRFSEPCMVTQSCPVNCDDDNPCTMDICDQSTKFKCKHRPVTHGLSCSDGNACNGAEVCKGVNCKSGRPLACDDHNPCTANSCDPVLGCVFAPVPDGTSCPAVGACSHAGICIAGECNPGPVTDCDDGNPCTADSCNPNTGGCTHVAAPNGTDCGDGNACNGAETCQHGTCQPSPPPRSEEHT